MESFIDKLTTKRHFILQTKLADSYGVLWNKKWDGKCPDRIQRQVLKNSYELGGLKATDMAALNS